MQRIMNDPDNIVDEMLQGFFENAFRPCGEKREWPCSEIRSYGAGTHRRCGGWRQRP